MISTSRYLNTVTRFTAALVFTALWVALVIGDVKSFAADLSGGNPLSPLAKKLLDAPAEQLATFEKGRRKGLIEIDAVHLPENPPGDCNHYGWPISTIVADTVIVMHRRVPGPASPTRICPTASFSGVPTTARPGQSRTTCATA